MAPSCSGSLNEALLSSQPAFLQAAFPPLVLSILPSGDAGVPSTPGTREGCAPPCHGHCLSQCCPQALENSRRGPSSCVFDGKGMRQGEAGQGIPDPARGRRLGRAPNAHRALTCSPGLGGAEHARGLLRAWLLAFLLVIFNEKKKKK